MSYIYDTEENPVLKWIDAFFTVFGNYANSNQTTTDEDIMEPLRLTFRAGYCWHFAHMLQSTFNRGQVCWAAPFSHFVWVDADGTVYDCEGIYEGEAFYYIPEEYMPTDTLTVDFKHIPDVEGRNATKEDIIDIMHHFCDEEHIPYDNRVEHLLK